MAADAISNDVITFEPYGIGPGPDSEVPVNTQANSTAIGIAPIPLNEAEEHVTTPPPTVDRRSLLRKALGILIPAGILGVALGSFAHSVATGVDRQAEIKDGQPPESTSTVTPTSTPNP